MKKLYKTLCCNYVRPLLMVLCIGFASCEDDDDVIVIDPNLAEDDVEELMAILLSYDAYGLVAHFEHIGDEIEDISDCDETVTNTEVESGDFNRYDYEYTFTEEYTLFCGAQQSLSYSLTGEQEIDALNYDTIHLIGLDFTTTGLEDGSSVEVYNGTYNTSGDWESNITDEGYDFVYDSTITDVEVAKDNNKIVSGVSIFSLEQTYSRDNLTYTYSGTITFLNENEAEVTFEDGETFIVDLNNVSIAD